MRKLALIAAAALAAALAVASTLAAARGTAASKPGLEDALARTAQVSSLRYGFRVGLHENGIALALHVHGRSNTRTMSVHLATAGMSATEFLDGSFLYEGAPNGVAVNGKWRWLRLDLASTKGGARAVAVLHALTPEPLLQLIGESRLHGAGPVYRGSVPFDDPVVRAALDRLTGGVEFRRLRATVRVGDDDLIHRLRLTGKTADGSSSLVLVARLFAFNLPVHVSPPKPGTFMDRQLAQLRA